MGGALERGRSGDAGRSCGVRAGLVGGLLASLPVLGPVLGAACLSCVGFGGAAAGGAALGAGNAPASAVGGAVLALAGWRTVRRVRLASPPEERRRRTVGALLVLAVTALATYLLVNLVVVPALAGALEQLGRAFGHAPTVAGPPG